MHRFRLASLVRRWALVTGLALGCVGTGCGGGGQTGGESPLPAHGGGCAAQLQELTLDALTPLGATAERVLEPVLGTNTAPLLWSSNTGSLTIGPERGLGQIELTVTYAGGRVSWAHFAPDADEVSGGAVSTLSCAVDRLEVELDVWLRTSGGALDEHFVATLGAPSVDNAQLTTNLSLDELDGSFFVMAPADVVASTMQVTAVWDVLGFRGTLMGGVEMTYRDPNASSRDSGAVGFGLVPFAEWPPPRGNGGP
jgi:hypothetical protein